MVARTVLILLSTVHLYSCKDNQAILIELNNNLAKFANKQTYVAFEDFKSEEARFTVQQDRKEIF